MTKSIKHLKDLSLFLLLASAIFILSCKNNTSNKNVEEVKNNNNLKSDNKKTYHYNKNSVIKEITFKNNNKELTAIFLQEKYGELGNPNFHKKVEVLILDNGILVDKFIFENLSLLCDLKLFINNIKILNNEDKKNQYLFFAVIDSCDGEEPNTLNINIWDSKKENYKMNIPVFFNNEESKNEFHKDISNNNFKTKEVKENIFNIIEKLTGLDNLITSEWQENTKDYKCFNTVDVNSIELFVKNISLKHNFIIDSKLNSNYILDYLNDIKCKKTVSFSNISNCTDKLKCEVYCFFNRSKEELEEGDLNEEILYLYFKKQNEKIYLYKIG